MLEFWRLSWRVSYRHWSIYKKNFLSNISPTFADPLFYILTFGIGLGSLVSDVDGISYIQYMAPGLAISWRFGRQRKLKAMWWRKRARAFRFGDRRLKGSHKQLRSSL